MRRITKAALGGVAGCALILGATQAANGDAADITYPLEKESGDFWPYDPDDPAKDKYGPFDDAEGALRVIQSPDNTATGFKLTVTKIDGAAGKKFGAHLHTGPCVDGDYTGIEANQIPGGKAGPHYNHDVAAHGKTLPTATVPLPPNPAEISTDTEVWFDLVPNDHGEATDDTKVNFVPLDSNLQFTPGVMSVVIHANPTNPATGGAGDRQACFNLLKDDWRG